MRKNVFITTLLAVLLLASQSVFVQAAGQTPQPEKRFSYNMINEYGIFGGSTIGFSGVFINSLQFNHSNTLLGIGVGYSIERWEDFDDDITSSQGIPMFFNFRHYFDRGRKLQPLINIAAGTTFYFWKDYNWHDIYYDDDEIYEKVVADVQRCHGFGLYTTIASGFRVKALSFTAGFFLHTNPANHNSFGAGIDVKVGYTF